jgi:hypothetical protein
VEVIWEFAQSYILKSEGEFGLVETVPPRRALNKAEMGKTLEEAGWYSSAARE